MIAHGSCIVNTRFRIQDERMDDLGSLIRRTREERGLVQAALARMAEIPQGTLSRIETGSYKDVPPPEIIGALSRVLEIPQYQMLRLIGYDVGPATSVDTDTDPVLQELIDRLRRLPLTGERPATIRGVIDQYADNDRVWRESRDLIDEGGNGRHESGVGGF